MEKTINIYTDGSSRGNPGPGGCAAILESGDYIKEISKGFRKTTNNRMELLALILALESLKCKTARYIVYSDSKYVINAITKGWLQNWIKIDFKNKKNKDLWLRFYKIANNFNIEYKWIKGHNGHEKNEKCDKLAIQASKHNPLNVDYEYEALEKYFKN